jgi:hypothetical protein
MTSSTVAGIRLLLRSRRTAILLSCSLATSHRAGDFVRAGMVCKEWKRVYDDDSIWKEIYQRFGFGWSQVVGGKENWRCMWCCVGSGRRRRP